MGGKLTLKHKDAFGKKTNLDLSSAGTLHLAYSGTMLVHDFALDGEPMPKGIYGASDNVSVKTANRLVCITGTGLVNVIGNGVGTQMFFRNIFTCTKASLNGGQAERESYVTIGEFDAKTLALIENYGLGEMSFFDGEISSLHQYGQNYAILLALSGIEPRGRAGNKGESELSCGFKPTELLYERIGKPEGWADGLGGNVDVGHDTVRRFGMRGTGLVSPWARRRRRGRRVSRGR